MDIQKVFAVDEARLVGGVWHVLTEKEERPVEECDINGDLAILIAGLDSPNYRQVLARRLTRASELKRTLELDRDTREQIMYEAMAEAVVLDWKNFSIGNEPIHYSPEKALEFLTKPKWIRLRDKIMGIIGDTSVFKLEREETIVKNF